MTSTNNSHDPPYTRPDWEGLQSAEASDPRSGLQPVTPTPPYEDHLKHQHQHQLHVQHGNALHGGYHTIPGTSPHHSPTMTLEKYPHQQTDTNTTGSKNNRILGMRRVTFWLTASNILLAIALVLVGVLPSQLGKNTTDKTNQNTTPTDPPSNNSPGTFQPPICFNTTKKSSPGTPPGNPRPECPLPLSSGSESESTYTVPRTNLTFSRLCNTDYPNNDMAQIPVSTMQDCLAICAQLNLFPSSVAGPCVGVTWVYDDDGDPQGQGISYCFPKSVTGRGVTRAGTESAFLVV